MTYDGIWWGMHAGLHTWPSGPKHGATTENAKRYIDFSAANHLGGTLVEGWNVGWNGDWIGTHGSGFSFTQAYPDYDLRAVASYAKAKGISLIMHNETAMGIPNYESQLDSAFSLYRSLGVTAIKSGYVNDKTADGNAHTGQYMVRHHRKVIETAAHYGITVNAHEPIMDTGERRTWPNMLSREGSRGQEYNAGGPDGGNPPEHETILFFTRLLAGPMEYTPGIFDLVLKRPTGTPRTPDQPRVRTTLAKQLADYVVLYSPLAGGGVSDTLPVAHPYLDVTYALRYRQACILTGVDMPILDQPLRAVVQASPSDSRLTPVAEAVVARVATMVYQLVSHASPAAVMTAAVSGSDVALVSALADLVGVESQQPDPVALARLRGHVSLAARVAESGGVWPADKAIEQLNVTRSTLQNWRTSRRVVALERDDGSFAYPVAQFQQPRSDMTAPRPYPALMQLGSIVGDRLTAEELVVLLATPQEELANADGRSRTAFDALAAGDVDAVVAMVTRVVTPADAGAPLLSKEPPRTI